MNGSEGSAAPRALLVDLSRHFGGASVRAADLALGGSGAGWSLATLTDSPAWQYASGLGLKVYEVGQRRIDPRIVGRLGRIIRSGGYHLVDAQNPQAKLWGALAARQQGAAFVSTLNSWPRSEYGASLRGYAYGLLERVVRLRSDLSIAVSSQIYQSLLAQGVPERRVVYIPAAIALRADEIADSGDGIRGDLGLPEDATLCIAVGRLAEAKGYPILLSAIGRLKDEFPTLHCLIVGEGDQRPTLEQTIDQSGLKGRVHLLGFLPRGEALTLVKGSDLFVMPSLTEGTPIALLEAAALGRPIVATRVGGIPVVLEDGVQASLVAPGDPEQLAMAIANLIRRPEKARGIAERAKAHVLVRYGLEHQVLATTSAYRQALDNMAARRTSS